MNKPLVSLVGWFLLLTALGFYLYGIGFAVQLSWSDKSISETAYPQVLESVIASIQALLLTNLGILLGVSVASPGSQVAQQLLLGRTKDGLAVQNLNIPDPLTLREKIQLFALGLYVLSLIACVVTWAVNNFSSKPEEVVPFVAASGKMFFGVVLAYLTAVLSSKPNGN